MTGEKFANATKTFRFSYPTCTNEEVLFKLEVPVEIPHAGSTKELVQRVINMFHIPVYLEDELNEKLAEFVHDETKNFHNERDEKLLNQLKNGELNVEGIVKNWEKQFKDNVMEFAEQKGTSDDEVFAAAYNKLVHSPALETILQVENAYAKTVMNTIKNRDDDIQKLTQRQTEEMEEKMRLLGTSTTEAEMNEMAARHFEEQSLAAGRWGSQLDALCRAQRAQHRAWLVDTLQQHACADLHSPTSPLTMEESVPRSLAPVPGSLAPEPRPRLEESFTIHLGSQLKQTHNVRIVALDMMDLCTLDNADSAAEAPWRLQGALGLYSWSLSALVLLAGRSPSRPARLTPRLLAAAAASTDHHFPHVERQLRDIAEQVKEPVARRDEARAAAAGTTTPGTGSTGSSAGSGTGPARSRHDLSPGDVFVTRHSNLPDAHVVFHLVADDSALRSGDITSRHPAILGLRNILKAACANDITSICIPLLLRHDLSEECTAAWCVRRAELVLKCVKGFVLEGGAGPHTLHFAAPALLAPDLFHALANLLPAIFRVSNPVKVKPTL